MLQDLQNTYTKLTYVHDDSYWAKHIYLTKTLPEPADYLDCSFLCRNVEKPNGCDLFLMEVYSKKRMLIALILILMLTFFPRIRYVILENLHILGEILKLL